VLNGLAVGVAVVCGLAVLSRLHPSWFPADTAARFYATDRLAYPFDYSDGVGEFAALGIPLLLFIATGGRTLVGRALAAAALPLVFLCLAMTVSRGGILAAAVGLIAFVALAPDRLPKLITLATTAAATAVLIVSLLARKGVQNEFMGVAPSGQRHSLFLITIATLILTAAAHAGIELVLRRRQRPAFLEVSRRAATRVAIGIAGVVVIAVIVLAAAGAVHSLWQEFKRPNPRTGSTTYVRLLSVAGSHRYQYWQAAIHAFKSAPVKGIGPGTFEFYWAQHNSLAEFVRNAHSLWIETLAEDGLVGAALIVAFFLAALGVGAVRTLRAAVEPRLELTAAVAGVAAFCAAAAFDWVWQIGVMPMIAMVLAAVALVSPDGVASPATPARNPPGALEGRTALGWARRLAHPRIALALAALPAMWAIAVPLATTVSVRRSQAAAARGNVRTALSDASAAQDLEPGAASPRLQRALLLEQLGNISGAETAIAAARAREPNNWRLWLVSSRIETEADHPDLALDDYRRAKDLNPTSPIFR
jgi:O-antigen ligase